AKGLHPTKKTKTTNSPLSNHPTANNRTIEGSKKKPKKPKKRPFVKAAVREKWANRSEEENQAARERSRQAKQGQKQGQRQRPQSPWSKAEEEVRGNNKPQRKKPSNHKKRNFSSPSKPKQGQSPKPRFKGNKAK
ncbi:MAG: hypothetical protein KDI92_15150, partial [Xanthomonadales bacterium]|nr:hypothetical protein [Xanthomonadales bacterium]